MTLPPPIRAVTLFLALFPVLGLAGCVSTATTVVKAPFKVGGRMVDLATTSPSERDRAYTRRMRKADEREARERRAWTRRCAKTPDALDCREYDGYRARG